MKDRRRKWEKRQNERSVTFETRLFLLFFLIAIYKLPFVRSFFLTTNSWIQFTFLSVYFTLDNVTGLNTVFSVKGIFSFLDECNFIRGVMWCVCVIFPVFSLLLFLFPNLSSCIFRYFSIRTLFILLSPSFLHKLLCFPSSSSSLSSRKIRWVEAPSLSYPALQSPNLVRMAAGFMFCSGERERDRKKEGWRRREMNRVAAAFQGTKRKERSFGNFSSTLSSPTGTSHLSCSPFLESSIPSTATSPLVQVYSYIAVKRVESRSKRLLSVLVLRMCVCCLFETSMLAWSEIRQNHLPLIIDLDMNSSTLDTKSVSISLYTLYLPMYGFTLSLFDLEPFQKTMFAGASFVIFMFWFKMEDRSRDTESEAVRAATALAPLPLHTIPNLSATFGTGIKVGDGKEGSSFPPASFIFCLRHLFLKPRDFAASFPSSSTSSFISSLLSLT